MSKKLFSLFTDDVLQTADRSQGQDSGGARRPQAFELASAEAEEEEDANHLDEDDDTDEPHLDDEGDFLATEDVVSDVDDDIALDDEDYHSAPRGEKLAEESSCCTWLLSRCCPIRPDKPKGKRKGESPNKIGRGNTGRALKGAGRSSDSRGRGTTGRGKSRSGSGRDAPSSSPIGFKCGATDHWARDCPRMDDGSSHPKK